MKNVIERSTDICIYSINFDLMPDRMTCRI